MLPRRSFDHVSTSESCTQHHPHSHLPISISWQGSRQVLSPRLPALPRLPVQLTLRQAGRRQAVPTPNVDARNADGVSVRDLTGAALDADDVEAWCAGS